MPQISTRWVRLTLSILCLLPLINICNTKRFSLGVANNYSFGNTENRGPWLWHSWQSGCFRHQRSADWIPTSQQFIRISVKTVSQFRKDKNTRKRGREWPVFEKTLRIESWATGCIARTMTIFYSLPQYVLKRFFTKFWINCKVFVRTTMILNYHPYLQKNYLHEH